MLTTEMRTFDTKWWEKSYYITTSGTEGLCEEIMFQYIRQVLEHPHVSSVSKETNILSPKLPYKWCHSTDRPNVSRLHWYAVIILHTQGHDCNSLSAGNISYCRENNRIMVWWQICSTAKVPCISPLISLFLLFLPVTS